MPSTTFTVRIEPAVKKRLEKLARSTGRSRSFLAAEALNAYLDVNEWQVTGIRQAMASLDRGKGVPHEQVKARVKSWSGKKRERRPPKKPKKFKFGTLKGVLTAEHVKVIEAPLPADILDLMLNGPIDSGERK